jgi:omega-amidase
MSDLHIALIQTALHWEDKPANLDMLQKKIEDIPNRPALIILPEMFSTGFSMDKKTLAETMEGSTVEWMRKTAVKKKTIITGSLIIKEENNYYNRLVWMLPTGEYGFYDKRHLFAYGKEDQHYSAGKKRMIASVNGWKINCQICYDLRFPTWIRQTRSSENKPEYDLLVVVANWPSVRSLAWRTLLQARAIENQCYVAGVNRTGRDGNGLEYPGESMIIGPLGEIITTAGSEEKIITHTLDRNNLENVRQKFPFWKDSDTFFIEP